MNLPWAEIATAWAVFAANILSPGPNVFNTIAIALGSGRRTALAVVPAVALGVLGWSSAALLGAAAVFRRVDWAEPALTLLGGVLLLWLASRYVRRAWSWDPQIAAQVIAPRAAFALTLGILATNPKALTTWLVLISIFPTADASADAVAVMIAGSVTLAALGHAGYALLFSTRPAARAYARAGRWVNAGVAVFFTVLAVKLIAGATAPG
ncbi:MAG TPA: LysE family transporter [Thermohalobaculum sp.]|nr:LysE family transporter [Thermohalobaculum sp.]